MFVVGDNIAILVLLVAIGSTQSNIFFRKPGRSKSVDQKKLLKTLYCSLHAAVTRHLPFLNNENKIVKKNTVPSLTSFSIKMPTPNIFRRMGLETW